MDQFLKALRHRKDHVQKKIHAEQSKPSPDGPKITSLKRLRLRFREQIDFIERQGRNSSPVVIPVVRRRSIRIS